MKPDVVTTLGTLCVIVVEVGLLILITAIVYVGCDLATAAKARHNGKKEINE